jgi:hypothetical protein
MKPKKHKIVTTWDPDVDIVEETGTKGRFRIIGKKAPPVKPARMPVKPFSQSQGSAQTAKQTITPSQPSKALRRSQTCDPFVKCQRSLKTSH